MRYIPPHGSTDPEAPYVDRSTGTATRGSVPPAPFFNEYQAELLQVLDASGVAPDADELQLATAIRSQRMNYFTAGGTANALTITPDPAFASLAELVGVPLRILGVASNTVAGVTLNVSGLGARDVTRWDASPLGVADWRAGLLNTVCYDGTRFRIVGPTIGEVAEAYALASQAQAEAGTNNDTIMTPLRVAQLLGAKLASQAEAEAGTDNVKLMTPLRTRQQITATTVGAGQTWANVAGSRSAGTSYQNTTGRPIMVAIDLIDNQSTAMQVSSNGSTWVSIGGGESTVSYIVPVGHYYRAVSGTTILTWTELR